MSMTPQAEIEKFLREAIRESKIDVVTAQKKISFDIFAGVIQMTPVDEGIARNGWQVGINEYPDGSSSEGNLAAGTAKINEVGLESVIFITNSVPYILVLDQGGFDPPDPGPSKDPRPGRKGRILVENGYSVQAPNGMVDATLSRIASSL